jgi:hypothetical protein
MFTTYNEKPQHQKTIVRLLLHQNLWLHLEISKHFQATKQAVPPPLGLLAYLSGAASLARTIKLASKQASACKRLAC